MSIACVLASVGCGRAESPFSPDFGVEETSRLSVSEEPPAAAEPHAGATGVRPPAGGEVADSLVKKTPGVSRIAPREPPLIVIDGVMQPEDWPLSNVESLDIDHVEVVKGASAVLLFGPRARGGAIDIRTKRGT